MENSTQAPTTRTFMCAVVFLDIVEYSKKPVARQLAIKSRFNEIVAKGLENVASADRIILDTGDGAALCFLGDPEDALFVTNSIRNDFAAETDVPELKVRLGINLGGNRLRTAARPETPGNSGNGPEKPADRRTILCARQCAFR